MGFARRHLNEVYAGGAPVLVRKSYFFTKRLCEALLVICAIPAALMARLLRPILLIKFGQLPNGRIGHFAINTELYLCDHDVNREKGRVCDLFYYSQPSCNKQLEKMWNRVLRIYGIARWVDKANRLMPGWEHHEIPLIESRDLNCHIGHTPPHLHFTKKEIEYGEKTLKDIGIPAGAPFICFHLRESTYLDVTQPHKDWHYNDFLDIKNTDAYLPAIEELTRRGYYVVRMGALVKKALSVKNLMVIDYAAKHRNDFLDIYLCATCRFFLASSSGLAAVPMIFRKPIAWLNFIPIEYIPAWHTQYLFICKKLRRAGESRFLTFKEIIDSGIGMFCHTGQYEQAGLEIIENTAEEIRALVIEMDSRLNNKWRETKEDEESQRRFWALFKPGGLNRVFLSHVGSEFLRENKNLLT